MVSPFVSALPLTVAPGFDVASCADLDSVTAEESGGGGGEVGLQPGQPPGNGMVLSGVDLLTL